MDQVVPYLCYDDAGVAIEFMNRAVGFTIEHAVHHPEEGSVLTAKVRADSGVILVGAGMDAFGTRAVPDADRVSAMIYVFVDDVRSHYARAKAEGATIRDEPHAHFGGNEQYTASDPGGHRWTFAQPVDDAPS